MIAYVAATLFYWVTRDVGLPFEQRAFLTSLMFCGIGLSNILEALRDLKK